jgi:hypothetical protein
MGDELDPDHAGAGGTSLDEELLAERAWKVTPLTAAYP